MLSDASRAEVRPVFDGWTGRCRSTGTFLRSVEDHSGFMCGSERRAKDCTFVVYCGQDRSASMVLGGCSHTPIGRSRHHESLPISQTFPAYSGLARLRTV